MDPTTAGSNPSSFAGQLFCIAGMAILMAFPLALFLLQRYRQAVLKAMLQRGGEGAVDTPPTGGASPVETAPKIRVLDRRTQFNPTGQAAQLFQRARAAPGQAARVFVLAVGAYALVISLLSLLAEGLEVLPGRFVSIFSITLWPAVLVVNQVAGGTADSRRRILAAYAILVLLTAVALAILVPGGSLPGYLLSWTIFNLPPTLSLLFFLNRRVRSVGPMVVTFTFMANAGASILTNSVGQALIAEGENGRGGLLQPILDLLLGPLGGAGLFCCLLLSGFVLAGLLGWATLRGMKQAYEHRLVSDQSLVVDAIVLVFTLSRAVMLSFDGLGWGLSGLLGFAAYRLVAGVGLRQAAAGAAGPARTPELLVLRVFSLGQRSEDLYTALSLHWRYGGRIRFIAGPDLLNTTVQPHQFLEFVAGHLPRLFISGPAAFEQRLAHADPRPDPDGRHRIMDFFCYDDTWKMVLRRLATGSDAIIMDLRGFNPKNAGCIFEVQELIQRVPIGKVVFVFDRTTDEPFLAAQFNRAWAGMDADSPNRRALDTPIQLYRLDALTSGDILALLRALCQAASSG